MSTKEKVLQRCRELCQTRNGVCWYIDDQTWISVRDNGPYKINSGSGSVKIGVSQNTPESDPVWPLAAQVLGIGGDAPKEDIDFLRWSIDPERKVADAPRADYVTILFDDHYQSERFVSALRRILTQ